MTMTTKEDDEDDEDDNTQEEAPTPRHGGMKMLDIVAFDIATRRWSPTSASR
jgi:hypothetical protein